MCIRDRFPGARLAVPLQRHGVCSGKVQVDFVDRGRKSGEDDDAHLRVKRVVSDVNIAGRFEDSADDPLYSPDVRQTVSVKTRS